MKKFIGKVIFGLLLTLVIAWPSGIFAQIPAHGVTLTWNASASPNVSYLVYRSATPGGPYVQLNAAALNGLTYFDSTGTLNGATEYYVVDALDSLGVESQHSNQVTVVTIGDPKAPTGLAGVPK